MFKQARCLLIALFFWIPLAILSTIAAHAAPFAYVTNPLDAGKVVVVDTATNMTVGSPISVGAQPIGIAMNPSGTRLYVANNTSNTVSVIDTETSAVIATIPVGLVPWGIAVNPTGTGYVYVANIGGNSVSVIDQATNSVVKTIGVGHDPVGVAVNPVGSRAYVTCSRNDINSVYIINTNTDTEVGHLVLGTFPYAVAVSPDSTRVYVTNRDSHSVSVIDATVPVVIKTISVGASPVGIAATPDGSRVYVVNGGADTLSVIDTSTNSVTGSPIPVGSGASSIAISGTRAYVGNYSGHSLSVVDLSTNQVVNTISLASNVWPTVFGIVIGQSLAPTTPTVSTATVTNITATTATTGGNVTADGAVSVTARGVCWSTSANPTTANSCTSNGTGTGPFISSITGLIQNTPYHVRAYATNSMGTAYGSDVLFTTTAPAALPSVTTTAISGITMTTATGGGNVTSDGGGTVSARGVCWSISVNPTTANSCSSDGSGTGAFVSSLSGLSPGASYHVRAYATNPAGTAYGADLPFTTATVDSFPPTVTAFAAHTTSNSWNIPITLFSASDSGGSVTGYCVTAVNSTDGCAWSASAPAYFTVSLDGEYTLYPWARDGTGNISSTYPFPVQVTVDTHAVLVAPWLQKAKLLAPESGWNDAFGVSAMSADGNTALISTFYFNSNQGAAFVFTRSVAGWSSQTKLMASDGTSSDRFGLSTAISADGNTAIIGAYQKNYSQGAAYVFTRSGASWTQQAKLTASDGAASDNFGYSVAISADGNSAIIGAHGKSSAQGAAYLFTRSGSNWSQQNKFTASNAVASDQFGVSVAMSGDGGIALIGAWGRNSNQGAAYVFTGSGSTWTERTILTATPAVASERFGYPVVLSGDGDTALIGTYNVGNAAYVFTGSGSSWSQQARLTGSDTATGDGFGVSVALNFDGNAALVGAYAKNSAQGAAYLFKRSASTWTEVAKPMPVDVVVSDWFGRFVAISGDGSTALIAAFNKQLASHGAAGAAYIISPPSVATVTTDAISSITATSASAGGTVVSDGGLPVTARGICLSTTTNPTLADSCVSGGSGTGAFTPSLTGLTQTTAYHVRAYATNAAGTAYGNQRIFNTDYPVSLTLQGSGVGVIHSSAPDINCGIGQCTQTYPFDSSVTLSPTPGYHSIFGGWQGSCSNPSGDCILVMNSIRALLASFDVDPTYAVWIDPGENYFNSIGAAYQAVGASAHIKACRVSLSENLLFNQGKAITLSGGYNSSYSDSNGLTTVNGTIILANGNVIVRNIVIR
ncbi:MAG: hypothetical protein HXX11_18200 [Desulfuromonadales bacterium]|nr:hypothetical protein [Desulfuromonadales bacterium]